MMKYTYSDLWTVQYSDARATRSFFSLGLDSKVGDSGKDERGGGGGAEEAGMSRSLEMTRGRTLSPACGISKAARSILITINTFPVLASPP